MFLLLDKVGVRANNRRRVNISRLVETLGGMISHCEILNDGVIMEYSKILLTNTQRGDE